MTAPIVVTLAAAALGWVALSKSRANMSTPGQPYVAGSLDNNAPLSTQQPRIEGGFATESANYDLPMSDGGADPSSQQSSPAGIAVFQYPVTYTVNETSRLAALQQAVAAKAPAPPAPTDFSSPASNVQPVALAPSYAAMKYGSTVGLTRAQLSEALATNGAASGAVW